MDGILAASVAPMDLSSRRRPHSRADAASDSPSQPSCLASSPMRMPTNRAPCASLVSGPSVEQVSKFVADRPPRARPAGQRYRMPVPIGARSPSPAAVAHFGRALAGMAVAPTLRPPHPLRERLCVPHLETQLPMQLRLSMLPRVAQRPLPIARLRTHQRFLKDRASHPAFAATSAQYTLIGALCFSWLARSLAWASRRSSSSNCTRAARATHGNETKWPAAARLNAACRPATGGKAGARGTSPPGGVGRQRAMWPE